MQGNSIRRQPKTKDFQIKFKNGGRAKICVRVGVLKG